MSQSHCGQTHAACMRRFLKLPRSFRWPFPAYVRALQSEAQPHTIPGKLLLLLSVGVKRENDRKCEPSLSPVQIQLEHPFKSGKIHPMTSAWPPGKWKRGGACQQDNFLRPPLPAASCGSSAHGCLPAWPGFSAIADPTLHVPVCIWRPPRPLWLLAY